MIVKSIYYAVGAMATVAVLFLGYQMMRPLEQSKDVGPGGYEMSVKRNQECDRTRELGRALHKSKADGIPMEGIVKAVGGGAKVDVGLRRIASEIYARALTSAEAEQLAWAICMDTLGSSR